MRNSPNSKYVIHTIMDKEFEGPKHKAGEQKTIILHLSYDLLLFPLLGELRYYSGIKLFFFLKIKYVCFMKKNILYISSLPGAMQENVSKGRRATPSKITSVGKPLSGHILKAFIKMRLYFYNTGKKNPKTFTLPSQRKSDL